MAAGGEQRHRGVAGVKHLCGSKPRSGQQQWPMFKVNGGLRWLFISRLLQPYRNPTATNSSSVPSSSTPSLSTAPSLSLSLYRSLSLFTSNSHSSSISCSTGT
ncbi:unnamed protein product [Boreogadus saida]